ncbi:MAG: hypothetical protein AB7L41_06670 [Flavobacteriaceae bacterium]
MTAAALLAAWKFLRSPAGRALALLLAAGLTLGGAYLKGRHDGRAAVLAALQSDRVRILKDGKEIDEKVLGADDSALCGLLGGCLPDDREAD